MERIVKKILLIITVSCIMLSPVLAEDMNVLTTPANISFEQCTRTYPVSAEKLYFLTLNSIAANRFETRELQSKTGYILFKAAGREFLATVAYYGTNKSILKITPANNVYYFAPGIVSNMFKYIDLYMDEPLKEISKS